ncbi:MAG: hypothetical protein OEZ48_01690 [Candidatus Bathyarchaeota archaeon]|nr:hypothetical protein [Candidatus Bathyarchaeota archaeon]
MKMKKISSGILFLFTLSIVLGVNPTSAATGEIVTNGSFEEPEVTHSDKWGIYSSIPGWNIEWMPTVPLSWNGYSRPSKAYIEIQREPHTDSGWETPYGSQWAELDSDWSGPGVSIRYEPASIAIYQDLVTVPGGVYELTFAYSPRPNVADNRLIVKWKGTVVANISGSGGSSPQWTLRTVTPLTATGGTTELRFEEAGPHDSSGMFLDAVSVTLSYVSVKIDVKPGNHLNIINLCDRGLLRVAILGSSTLDVRTIDPETIKIGSVHIAERGSRKSPKKAYSYPDVNGDGIEDLVAFFSIPKLVSTGTLTETTTSLTLTATLSNPTTISGTDSAKVKTAGPSRTFPRHGPMPV